MGGLEKELVRARDMRELVGGGGEGGEVSAVVMEELASAQEAVRRQEGEMESMGVELKHVRKELGGAQAEVERERARAERWEEESGSLREEVGLKGKEVERLEDAVRKLEERAARLSDGSTSVSLSSLGYLSSARFQTSL